MTTPYEIARRVTEFWANVDRGEPDDCWPWLGYQEDGYGRFQFDGRMVGAHELAVTFTTGERRSPELDTCHACVNSICCNPAHLRFDTRAGNMADSVRMGTISRTGDRPRLSDDDVRVIRARLANGAQGQAIAMQCGISQSLVSQIRKGRRYANSGR